MSSKKEKKKHIILKCYGGMILLYSYKSQLYQSFGPFKVCLCNFKLTIRALCELNLICLFVCIKPSGIEMVRELIYVLELTFTL